MNELSETPVCPDCGQPARTNTHGRARYYYCWRCMRPVDAPLGIADPTPDPAGDLTEELRAVKERIEAGSLPPAVPSPVYLIGDEMVISRKVIADLRERLRGAELRAESWRARAEKAETRVRHRERAEELRPRMAGDDYTEEQH